MKTAVAAIVLLFACGHSAQAQSQAQPQTQTPPQRQASPPAADLNAILSQIQQTAGSINVDIGKLRIEKWKTDSEQRQQLQQIAESLQKNIANAIPGMVTDVQTSRGAVSASFRLYHNLNVVYENLNYLADVAGSLGKKEEFEPVAADCAALESARKNLSIYIEQAAGRLESANRPPNPAQARQVPGTLVPGKKVVVIDDTDPPPPKHAKPTKKKTSTPPAAAPTQSSATPR